MELRKFPPFESKGIPAGSRNKGTQMAECVGKLSFDPAKSPPVGDEEIPARNRNKGIQKAECIGKSNLELEKFPSVGSEEIPARGRNTDSRESHVWSRGNSSHLEARKFLPKTGTKKCRWQSVSGS